MIRDDAPSREELLDALRAVLEAVDVPHAATAGGQEKRDGILIDRVGHVAVMLRSLLTDDARPDWEWSTAYLRERLAEHPAEGYTTWDELVAELEAARAASPAGAR